MSAGSERLAALLACEVVERTSPASRRRSPAKISDDRAVLRRRTALSTSSFRAGCGDHQCGNRHPTSR